MESWCNSEWYRTYEYLLEISRHRETPQSFLDYTEVEIKLRNEKLSN